MSFPGCCAECDSSRRSGVGDGAAPTASHAEAMESERPRPPGLHARSTSQLSLLRCSMRASAAESRRTRARSSRDGSGGGRVPCLRACDKDDGTRGEDGVEDRGGGTGDVGGELAGDVLPLDETHAVSTRREGDDDGGEGVRPAIGLSLLQRRARADAARAGRGEGKGEGNGDGERERGSSASNASRVAGRTPGGASDTVSVALKGAWPTSVRYFASSSVKGPDASDSGVDAFERPT